jgi:selenocysteine lyase/cysteine desulfurase
MNHNPTWQNLFPAVFGNKQRIFLNNRHGTQIPGNIIESMCNALNSGIDWNDDHESTTLRQRLAAFLHVDTPDAFFFSESEAGLMHWLVHTCLQYPPLQYPPGGSKKEASGTSYPLAPRPGVVYQEKLNTSNVFAPDTHLTIKEFVYKENGEFDFDSLFSLLSAKPRLIFVPHIHPVFGTKNEEDIAFIKQQVGDQALVVVDLSQSVGRIPIYLERLHCDCAFFSGSNMFSPFHCGIGYIQHRPCSDIFLQQELAHPLAAQTLVQGIDLLEQMGMEKVALHLQTLSRYLLTRLRQIAPIEFLPGIAHCEEWCSPGYGILSFRLPGISAEECMMLLAENALLVDRADIPQYQDAITVSLHLYNTTQHIDALADCLQQLCSYS